MIFSSLVFIFAFLPAALAVYHLMPKKLHKHTLLTLSVIFCLCSGAGFLVFVAVYTLFSYAAGRLCGALRKRRILSGTVVTIAAAADIFILLFFRRDILSGFSADSGIVQLIIPVGISFMTLSAISYLIDVRRGETAAEKNFCDFSLYILFFPKLPMGPHISYKGFRRSLENPSCGLSDLGMGLTIFVKGLAKKVLLADNIYLLFSAVRNDPVEELTSLSALLGVISFFFCLYFTLSGMSDMGRGLARCFGIRLSRSFRHPAASIGLSSMSAKWHIPVISWFRKYIVTPSAAMISNRLIRSASIIAASVLFGLWYRFSLNMLIWGLIMGIVLACEKLFFTEKLMKPTKVMYTYLLTCFGMVFFFSDDIMYTLRYFTGILSINSGLADAGSLYLLREYAPVLLLCLIVSADIPGRFIGKKWKRRIKTVLDIVSPLLMAVLLALCTIEISYTGVSEMTLPILQEVSR